jgi:hypothetical protein
MTTRRRGLLTRYDIYDVHDGGLGIVGVHEIGAIRCTSTWRTGFDRWKGGMNVHLQPSSSGMRTKMGGFLAL